MDNTALQELESFLKVYESENNNNENIHDIQPTSNVNNDESTSNMMQQDIKELLDIVRNKLDTPNTEKQQQHLSIQNEAVTPNNTRINSKESEQTFWNDMLKVLSSNTTPIENNNISKSKSTGNLLQSYDFKPTENTAIYQIPSEQESEILVENDLLNTPLLNHSKSEYTLNVNKNTMYNNTNECIEDNIDYQRIKMRIDEYENKKQDLLRKQANSSKKRVNKLQNAAKDYLDKNGIKMNNNVRQEFLKDFRDSVDQIRIKINSEYSNKINNLTQSFDDELALELENYENELKYKNEQKIQDIKGTLLSNRATKMKNIRDKHQDTTNLILTKLQNELELENEARLSHLQNIMEKERNQKIKHLKLTLQKRFETRYDSLKHELSANEKNECKMYEISMKNKFENKCQELKSQSIEKIEKYKTDLNDQYAQNIVNIKLKLTQQYDKQCNFIENNLCDKNQKLKDEIESKLNIIHENKMKEIERELNEITFKIKEENKVKLENQKIELNNLRIEKIKIVKEHCLNEYNKLYETNKINAESQFQKEKLDLMKEIDNDFKDKTEKEIAQLRQEFNNKHESVLETYKNKLQIALKADIEKEKQILKNKQKKVMDKLENKFKKQKKEWLDKINGAAIIDKKNSLKKLYTKLEKEKNKSITEMCEKIQQEKEDAINVLKQEHENKKRQKFREINNKYLNDPAFEESAQILEIKEEMNEEINLLERFEMFAKRIKSLQDQIKMMNGITNNAIKENAVITQRPSSAVTTCFSPNRTTGHL